MIQPPDNFNFDESQNGLNHSNLKTKSEQKQEPEEYLSKENVVANKKRLERLFAILLGIGLSLGVLLAVGLIMVLNKLGLTEKPNQIEKIEEQSQ